MEQYESRVTGEMREVMTTDDLVMPDGLAVQRACGLSEGELVEAGLVLWRDVGDRPLCQVVAPVGYRPFTFAELREVANACKVVVSEDSVTFAVDLASSFEVFRSVNGELSPVTDRFVFTKHDVVEFFEEEGLLVDGEISGLCVLTSLVFETRRAQLVVADPEFPDAATPGVRDAPL